MHYLSIKHFRYFLKGREFTVFTDHAPLTNALVCKTERSPRQTRHLEFISEFILLVLKNLMTLEVILNLCHYFVI